MKKILLSLSLVLLAHNVLFTQSCEPHSVPLYENFQTAVFPGLPECWSRIIDGSGEIATYYPEGNADKPLYCYMYIDYDGSALLISPELDHPLAGLRMVFTSSTEEYANLTFEIGTISDPADITTYSSLVQISGSKESLTRMIYFNEYSGNDRHIVFRLNSEGYNWGYWNIFDILIEPIPECPAPWDFLTGEITSSSVEVGWKQPGDIQNWDLVYGEPGFDPELEGILIEDLEEPFYLLTDLKSNSFYHLHVRARCESPAGQWSPFFKIKTGCGKFEIPLSEDFKTDIWPPPMPDCWSKFESGNTKLNIHNGYVSIFPGTGPGSAFLFTPELAPSAGGLLVEIEASHVNPENSPALKIGSVSEPGDMSTFTQLTEVLLTSRYEKYTVYFDDENYPRHIVMGSEFTGNESWGNVQIAEINISTPECASPWLLTADEITPTTARLSWTQPGVVDLWDIIYGEYGFQPQYDQGTIIENLEEPSYILEDLAQGRKYDFRVRAVCNGERSGWSAPFSFITACGLHGTPLFEDFLETPNNYLPACWSKIEDGKATVKTSWQWADIFVEQGAGYLITPELDQPLQELRLKFRFFFSDINEGVLHIGSMTDPADLTTFKSFAQIALFSDFEEKELTVYFNEEADNDSHIAFVLKKESTSWTSRLHISEALIEEIPECPEPLDLSVGEITDTSVGLSWFHSKDIDNWQVAFGHPGTWDMPGFDPDNEGTLIGEITEKTFVVTGLDPGRHYQFYVRGICTGEPGEWSRPITVLTECGPVNIPFFEDFGRVHYQLPHCWNKIEEGYTDVYSGPNGGTMYSHGGSGYLITPELPSPLSSLRLVFMARATGEKPPSFETGTMADPEDKATFTPRAQPGLSDEFELYYLTFDELANGDRHIAFRIEATDQDRGTIEIPYIEIRDISDCMKPWGLSSSNLSYSSTRVRWIHFNDIDKWDVAWGLPGFDPYSGGTLIEDIGENSYVIEGLESSTSYQFYVRGQCNGTPGEWSGPHEFLTMCGLFDVPLIEDFDDSYDIPLCWTAYSADITSHKFDSDHCVQLNQEPDKPSFLISPQISSGLKDLRVSFYALRPDKTNWGRNHELILGTMVNPSDTSTFTAFASFYVMDEIESDFQKFIAYFDTYEGDDSFIAFKLGSKENRHWSKMMIDNIVIEVIPECPEPWSPSATEITRTSAVIAWSQVGDAEKWDLAYGHPGNMPGSEGFLIEGIEAKTYEISGLDPGTFYQVYLRAHCSDKTSKWSIPYKFFTECAALQIPFSESFNSSLFPLCWSQTWSNEIGSARWEVEQSSGAGGSPNQMTARGGQGTGISRLISPPLDLSPAMSVNLQFKHLYHPQSEGEVVFKIQTSRDRENWVDEDFMFEAVDYFVGPETIDVPITNISDNTYIAWVIDGNHSNFSYWLMDDAKVTYEPATPEVEWPEASPVTYGDLLSESTLEGGHAWYNEFIVAGIFYFDNRNLRLDAGENQQVAVTFLPEKGFNHLKGFITITVYRADPEVTWPEAGTINEGEPLSESALTGGSASHNGVSVPGVFIFQDPETIPPKGEYQADVIFVPDDRDNYNDVAGTVKIEVTGPTHSVMVPGGVLSEIQVFPNPFASGITLLNAREARRVKMTDVVGQVVIDVMLTGSETETIRTAHLPTGVYLMTIYGENEETKIIRMVRTR